MNALSKQSFPPQITLDAFLEWVEDREGRYELADGEVFAMSRESVEHARLKGAAWLALLTAIRKAGLPCEAILDGPGVTVANTSYFVPDVIVACGKPLSGNISIVAEPMIVVEVLSPSTKVFDVEYKLFYYLEKSSIQHYLIVDGKHRRVVRHSRTGPSTAITEVIREGDVVLDPPGFTVPFAEFFTGLDAG